MVTENGWMDGWSRTENLDLGDKTILTSSDKRVMRETNKRPVKSAHPEFNL